MLEGGILVQDPHARLAGCGQTKEVPKRCGYEGWDVVFGTVAVKYIYRYIFSNVVKMFHVLFIASQVCSRARGSFLPDQMFVD